MTAATETVTVVTERDLPHAPDKVWRALTQQHLIADWLMNNDFEPTLGHKFKLTADWGSVDCQVTAIDPVRRLVFTWTAYGMETLVTWTLTPTAAGTHLRMEQAGFAPDRPQNFNGAKFGWAKFADALEKTLASLD